MRRMIIRALPVLILIGTLLAFSGMEGYIRTGSQEDEGYPLSADLFLLDTFCTITIYEGGGQEALQDAKELLIHYDLLFGPDGEDSDIRRINERSTDRVDIDPDTAGLFESILPVYEAASGDLEVTIEPLTELWDVKERTVPPDEEEIESALSKVCHGGWHIEDGSDGRSFFVAEDPVLRVDVGAFAKGYIADRLRDRLMKDGVSSGIINLGGNVLCFGSNMDGGDMHVGIRDPEDSSSYIMEIPARDISVVTAGIYERYFDYDGVRYHHIIDPATGYPVQNELLSVTVTGESSALCDALATTLLIKGTEEGTAFLKEFNEEQGSSYKAYFINRDREVTGSEDDTER